MVEFGPVADLFSYEPSDDPGAGENRYDQACQGGENRTEHDVFVGVETELVDETFKEMQQMINQISSCLFGVKVFLV